MKRLISSGIVPITILSFALGSAIQAEQLLFFDFNDASDPGTATDITGNGRDGILAGPAAYTAPGGGVTGGAGDRALDLGDFNNGAFLDLTDVALDGGFDPIEDTDSATIAFWLHGNDEQPVNQWTFWFGPDRQLGSHAPWGDGTVYFDVAGCCGANQRIARNIPDRSLYSGQWNHYAYVKEETYTAIYINGELFHDSGNDDKDPVFGITEATFGADATGGSSHGGMMDDIGVWNNALSEDQIRAVMGDAPPTAVAGAQNVGAVTLRGTTTNQVFGEAGPPSPGLAQEWFKFNNPGSKAGVDDIFDNEETMVPPFQAGHGATWWTGNQAPIGDLVQYPDEIDFDGANLDQYVVRATGELRIEESGTYRFSDGVDDYTYLAVDADMSGTAGDSPEEILIDDNAWTSVDRTQNNGGQGLGEIDITVPEGGAWIALEFNMGEGGGSDAGVIYWDFNTATKEVGGGEGFPDFPEDPLDPIDAESLYIPDTHLRSSIRELESAETTAELSTSRPFAFELDGDSDTADKFVVENRDPDVFTTTLDVDGATFILTVTGDVADGDTFDILDADNITGTPIIQSGDPALNWLFNPLTGEVTLSSDPASAIDAIMDLDARIDYVHNVACTWMGDSNLDGEFNSTDLVEVFQVGEYEDGIDGNSTWSEGDWDGDKDFSSSDFVVAFQDGGFEQGPFVKDGAAAASVPEPQAFVLFMLGLLAIIAHRRN